MHNNSLSSELLGAGFISTGWDELGGPAVIAGGREGLVQALEAERPDAKARSIASQAGRSGSFPG